MSDTYRQQCFNVEGGFFLSPLFLLQTFCIFDANIKTIYMNLQLTVSKQEALMYAITITLRNKERLMTSNATILELEEVLDKLVKEENVRMFI